jgi:hypothetical protein
LQPDATASQEDCGRSRFAIDVSAARILRNVNPD